MIEETIPHKKRIGLKVPNTMMEVDFYRNLPEQISLRTARMLPDVVVFGCTSAGALRGDDFDALFVSCTNFPAMQTLNDLRGHFTFPVITSNQIALESTLYKLENANAS